ncbi:MAG: hypothetical protein MPJ50_02815 [Pirellulales bacterium]|nr:hypothetical protein [Pirellulales bacterium]
MNCQDFLENVTHRDGKLTNPAAAHLAVCTECRKWYAKVHGALTLFATANAGAVTTSVLEPRLAPCVERKCGAIAVSKLLEERSVLARRLPAARKVINHQLVKPSCAFSAESGVLFPSRRALHRFGNAALRVAATALILLLAISFLALPDSGEPTARPLAASLLDPQGTLDSIGLVSACVEPRPLDVHSSVIANHLQELPCCTRCHVAPLDSHGVSSLHEERFTPAARRKVSLLAGEHPPRLSKENLNRLSASCLLCHKG